MADLARPCIQLRAEPGFRTDAFALRVERLAHGLADDPKRLAEVVEHFVSAANAGMCSGERFSAEASMAQANTLTPADGAMVEIGCRQLDPGALRLLANLLRKAMGPPGASVPAIVVEGPAELPSLPGLFVEALAYPAQPRSLAFEVDLVLPEESLTPLTIRLSFSAPLSDADFALLEQRMALWRAMVAGGAYAHPDAEASDLPDMDGMEVYLLSAWQVEVAVYGFVAADAAFDGLVGLLAHTAAALTARLVSLEVW